MNVIKMILMDIFAANAVRFAAVCIEVKCAKCFLQNKVICWCVIPEPLWMK